MLEPAPDLEGLPVALVVEYVGEHADRLVELDVIEPVPETTPTRYRVADSEVVEALRALNAALNAAADDAE